MSGEAGSGTASVPRWNGKREKPQNLSPRDIAAVKWKKHLRKSGKSASRDSIKSKVLGKLLASVRPTPVRPVKPDYSGLLFCL